MRTKLLCISIVGTLLSLANVLLGKFSLDSVAGSVFVIAMLWAIYFANVNKKQG